MFEADGLTCRFLKPPRGFAGPATPETDGVSSVDRLRMEIWVSSDALGRGVSSSSISTRSCPERLWRCSTRVLRAICSMYGASSRSTGSTGARSRPPWSRSAPATGGTGRAYAHLARETDRVSSARAGGSIGADIGAAGTAGKDGPCQGRRETRPKGGAKHCHRSRGGEVVRGGRDWAWGGGSRKRREGVARPEFPADDGVVISPRGPFSARGCG